MTPKLLAGFSAFLAASTASAQTLTNAPNRPTPVPFTETVFGDRVDDPYRWMESSDRAPDVTAFIRGAGDHTRRQLDALPGRAALRARVDAGTRAGVRYGGALQVGRQLFYQRTDAGAQYAKLVVRDAAGRERVLYDPERANGRGAINSYSVAPDGRTVAIHTAQGGSEVGPIWFIDVASGTPRPDRLEPVWGEFEVDWLDGETYAYTRMMQNGPGQDGMQNMRAFIRRLGSTDERPVLGAGIEGGPAFQPQEFPFVGLSSETPWAFGLAGGARADGRLMVARRDDVVAGRPSWRAIADYADQISTADIDGDRLYLLSTKTAPNGSVILLDLARHQGLADAVTVVPARSDLVLTNIVAADGGLYVLGQTDGIGRLFFLAPGAADLREIRLPLRGLVASLQEVEGGSGVTFQIQDWFTAPRWFRAERTRVTPIGLSSASYAGMRGARQVRETARSADGTAVPMDILLPAGRRAGRPMPMLLEAYGAYGANVAEPYYATNMFGLIESGGGVAFCGTRGGGERGRAWHEGGRAANKPNAHADLIACAERLIALGYTTPRHLTVLGTSAGGLLSPPAALRRPDLFAGLVANVAILNPTRLAVANNGPNQFGEMGNPTEEAGYRALLTQDSYRLLQGARDLPDTMLVVGLNDRRVEPWFSAKFAARALERFGDRRLVLLRTDPDAGHGGGSARRQMVDMWTDIFAFTLNRAGAPGFGAPAQTAGASLRP
jgi:prolyl oligopeptidase